MTTPVTSLFKLFKGKTISFNSLMNNENNSEKRIIQSLNRMKPILFIDRDGTLINEPPDLQIDSYEKLDFVPDVLYWLSRIKKEFDYYLVMVTNQDGLGSPNFPDEKFWGPHNLLLKALYAAGIQFDEILIDRSLPENNLLTRKPNIGLVKKFLNSDFDISSSWVIGDRETDEFFAQNIGCKAIRFGNKATVHGTITAYSWEAIYNYLKPKRKANINRKTTETEIQLALNLDGNGLAAVNTGIAFFNHMLEQFVRHSGVDLTLTCQGDLQVDEHHTIEDVGIALGQAIRQAIGTKRGIMRYGFALPMDESKARVLIDFSGRPFLKFKGKFTREYVGQMPTEMVKHFFYSIAYSALITLHIDFKGENDHHKIEAIFKAFGRSIAMAIKQEGSQIPSTKGTL